MYGVVQSINTDASALLKIAVEGAGRHAHLVGNHLHRGAMKALLNEERHGNLHDLFTFAHGNDVPLAFNRS